MGRESCNLQLERSMMVNSVVETFMGKECSMIVKERLFMMENGEEGR